ISYETPLLKPILDVTYGCIVYQEQVMQVFRALAGYSLGRADIVRRAMAKKKHDVMRKEREFFLYGEKDENGNVITEGAIARGVSEEAANRIFDDMSSFSSYAFNKAHAAAYSFVAYRTAYLKCHYPSEYFAALMTSMMDSMSKISQYTGEAKKNGVKVLPPSVNYSDSGFTPDGKTIRFGLLAVKNLGLGIIERLINEREENGKYTSMYDFCLRNYSREFNRKALEGLIKSGALDGLEDNRRQMLYNIEGVLSAVENEKRFSAEGQLNLFDEMDMPNEFVPEKMPEMDEELKLELEKEATGLYLSGHPMEKYSAFLSNAGYIEISDILNGKYSDGQRVTIAGMIGRLKVRQLKNNSLLASAVIEDMTASLPITIFSKAYTEYKELLSSKDPIILTGKIAEREDRDTEIICERVEVLPKNIALQAVPKKSIKKGLYLKIKNMDDESFSVAKQKLSEYSGNIPVIIYLTDTNKKLEAPRNLWVREDNALISSLFDILGEKNVKLVK
ncbi:MAG: DNA polymerase III subunit alpha, partial [Clostridia bacterium]|nr:DNA polymerase III subunit alpha [Clostridia bacterium]